MTSHRRPVAQVVRSSFVAALVFSAGVLAHSTARAVIYVSAGSGAWDAPATWTPPGVPGFGDNVTIAAGHTVGATGNPQLQGYRQVAVLRVNGTLTCHFPERTTGMPLNVVCPTIRIDGEIRGESSPGAGGGVFISPFGIPLATTFGCTFDNNGLVVGGQGVTDFGGAVYVDYVGGRATNRGTIRGGNGKQGGGVFVTAWNAQNLTVGAPALLRGGDGTNGDGGPVELTGWYDVAFPALVFATNGPGSIVRGGDALGGLGVGGHAHVIGRGFNATATNDGPPPAATARATVRGGDGCPGGAAVVVGAITNNRGILANGATTCPPGVAPPVVQFDPPTGTIEGGSQITGGIVEAFAGESLKLGSFASPDAIHADDFLRITLAPGGVLDLRGLSAGTNWMTAADSIVIRADNLLLDTGVTLDQIMSPAPQVSEGARFAELVIGGAASQTVVAGESVPIALRVHSASNLPDSVRCVLTDTQGWIAGPMDVRALLDPTDAIKLVPPTRVPNVVAAGVADTVHVVATSQLGGREARASVALLVRPGAALSVEPPAAGRALVLRLVPNPTARSSTIHFELSREGEASLDVLDLNGRNVRRLLAGARLGSGAHDVEWNGATANGRRAAPGIYWVRLRTGEGETSRKLVVAE